MTDLTVCFDLVIYIAIRYRVFNVKIEENILSKLLIDEREKLDKVFTDNARLYDKKNPPSFPELNKIQERHRKLLEEIFDRLTSPDVLQKNQEINTTIDPEMMEAKEQWIDALLPPVLQQRFEFVSLSTLSALVILKNQKLVGKAGPLNKKIENLPTDVIDRIKAANEKQQKLCKTFVTWDKETQEQLTHAINFLLKASIAENSKKDAGVQDITTIKDDEMNSIFFFAARYADENFLEKLKIFIEKNLLEARNNKGHTVLFWAAMHLADDVSSAKFLLEKQLNISLIIDNSGVYALDHAIAVGNEALVRFFSQNPELFSLPRVWSRNALHTAARLGEFEIVKYIAEKWPELNIDDEDGIKPVILAARACNNLKIVGGKEEKYKKTLEFLCAVTPNCAQSVAEVLMNDTNALLANNLNLITNTVNVIGIVAVAPLRLIVSNYFFNAITKITSVVSAIFAALLRLSYTINFKMSQLFKLRPTGGTYANPIIRELVSNNNELSRSIVNESTYMQRHPLIAKIFPLFTIASGFIGSAAMIAVLLPSVFTIPYLSAIAASLLIPYLTPIALALLGLTLVCLTVQVGMNYWPQKYTDKISKFFGFFSKENDVVPDEKQPLINKQQINVPYNSSESVNVPRAPINFGLLSDGEHVASSFDDSGLTLMTRVSSNNVAPESINNDTDIKLKTPTP